ncbi:hypothetical protein NON00_12675 [Roseomonas sp. GC11]|uniref:hypothetical protein n=1 Tax=Roseomonas sp. GC11 TaxID=2950546 RepID=UPI00210C327A|nr:hypothetical protein [Roseomonas sp. GC11]MCQ4160781.1 hypothetical protein [Roseomonas sp. GC11]
MTPAPWPLVTDWLRNRLTVVGEGAALAAFRAAAAGPGVLPWRFDLPQLEEEWRGLLAAPPAEAAISPQGARHLARRLGEAVVAAQARALATGPRCPLDLHRLLPVPEDILALGPEEPRSRMWLWSHWGTSRALRHVRALPAAGGAMAVEFWSADWSPWRALLALRENWPGLRFTLVPDHDAG